MRRFTRDLPDAIRSSFAIPKAFRQLFLIVILALITVTLGCGFSQGSHSTAKTSGQISFTIPEPVGTVGTAYNEVPTVTGGTAPYSFSMKSGTFPPGLVLNLQTGSLTGTPTQIGDYLFTVAVTDLPLTDSGATTVHIVIAADSGGDQREAISISPLYATLVSQATQQFAASVTGTSNTGVTWSTTSGTISSSGVFTAPNVSTNTTLTVTATSSTDSTLSATANVVVQPLVTLSITTSALSEANTGAPYTFPLAATGGATPYSWSLSAGALPSGIQLQSSGIISGTTPQSGTFAFTARVTDSAGNNTTRALSLSVSSSSVSGYDGPAELPRILIDSSVANTPAPGGTETINSGGDFQSALDNASCGDTIELQAGATYTGSFNFPAKNCDDSHWIIVRTSAPDSALPAEGSRLTPCYAGVASLPSRPALNCTTTTNVLAKLIMSAGGTGPIVFEPGANHYRLVGLEVTRTAGTTIVYSLASIAVGGTANNLILDRVWLHGTAKDETNKGFELIGASYISVVDSTFTDFHCTSISGSCTDAVAISAGTGNPVGPFKITGNFLEASGENILFGGSASATTPADIEIRQNHLFKPLTWLTGQPGFVGGTDGNAFVVKNLIEMKNVQRVLVEGNILEYSWGGFSQVGYGIVLTPKNQAASTGGGNLCPNCLVTDITVRYNTISHVGAGLQIANALSDNDGAAKDGERYSIHDIVVDDIDPVKYDGPGHVAEILTGLTAPLLRNVLINHVTAFPPSELFSVGDYGDKMVNFTFSNSLVTTGAFPIWSTGGGSTNCAYYDKPLITFDACFSPYSFAGNALIAAPTTYPPSSWPAGNAFPASIAAVQFVNYNEGIGGDYHLQSSSPYKNAGSDGKDLGADIDTIDSETAGVY